MNNQEFLDENERFDDDEPITPLDISQPKKKSEEEVLPEEEIPAPKRKRTPKKTAPKHESEGDGDSENEDDGQALAKKSKKAQIFSVLFWILSFLTAVFLIANIWQNAGPLIVGYSSLLYGLLGWGALFTVCLFMLFGLEWKRYAIEGSTLRSTLLALGFTVTLSALFHVIMIMVGSLPEPAFLDAFRFKSFWYTNRTVKGGGILGGLIGSIFYSLMHGWVSVLLLVLILVALVLVYLRLSPEKILDTWIKASAKRKKKKEEEDELRRIAQKLKEKDAEADDEDTDSEPVTTPTVTTPTVTMPTVTAPSAVSEPEKAVEPEKTAEPVTSALPKISVFKPTPAEEELKEDLLFAFDQIPEVQNTESELDSMDFGFGLDEDELDALEEEKDENALVFSSDTPILTSTVQESDFDDLDDILDDEDDSLMIGATAPATRPDSTYTFPPIDLLTKGDSTEPTESREDLLRHGQKLVEVLKSFRVDTEIVNIACGPTVTRYELAPKSGVRVRAIANLVDDIALNLETSGVRIEAPIPGKAAVGVEVPNKEASTVYLRDLIESEAFQNAKSKLTACVGMDVSGAPILMDISKMPHLLIAGATGMGKSVGVNSIIMSLLYKATPSELKLILVDPKKVELNMYNKLPHLLIPVVNNPKKAAGALATAVNEMERRFELIESVGARNIKGYNKLVENDPTKEQLPSIVIIIDELADLMMTAKDDVEDSICRIAQKARAAGIHLIICTQRPSVDVITGLIKANVPSRIAFTVASSIDSRTIIDIAGAEKLIGRGDMLFAPVGAMKPIRVQGAFVDDKEVEAVTDFIKNQSKDVQYDDSFLNQVEIEAERCGQQKKKVTADEIDADDELDPKFYEAVELAVDMGKISTSLLQRKLSLGYGRAAKIIDSMEAMGIVGAPDGQKPRNCLISRQEFQEMMMRREDQ